MQLISYFVCICAYFIWQFSCLKLSDMRDQFLFAFDPFLLSVLYQRGERIERVISLKSTNLKVAYSGVVAKSLNNVMVKLLFEKCIEFLASLFNLYESNTGTCFLLSDELYVLSDRKILATLISIRTLTGWRLRFQFVFYQADQFVFHSAQNSLQSRTAQERRKVKRSPNPSIIQIFNISGMAQRGTPGQLEARISWAKAGFRSGRVERPLY